MTFNYQKLNFYNIVQERVRHDILEITIQCNVEISQPQRAECTSRSHQLQISRNRADWRSDGVKTHCSEPVPWCPSALVYQRFSVVLYIFQPFPRGFNSFISHSGSHWFLHFLPQKPKELAKCHCHLLRCPLPQIRANGVPSGIHVVGDIFTLL